MESKLGMSIRNLNRAGKISGTYDSRSFSYALLLPALFLFVSGDVRGALNPTQAITQYTQDVWRTEAGLPHNSVLAIAQTPDGYLWLATEEGLARFDGVRF